MRCLSAINNRQEIKETRQTSTSDESRRRGDNICILYICGIISFSTIKIRRRKERGQNELYYQKRERDRRQISQNICRLRRESEERQTFSLLPYKNTTTRQLALFLSARSKSMKLTYGMVNIVNRIQILLLQLQPPKGDINKYIKN